MRTLIVFSLMNIGLLWAVVGVATADPPVRPEISGVFGLDSVGGEAWLAVRISMPDNSALGGMAWYNNDGSLDFPRILVGTGFPECPGLVAEFAEVAAEVHGYSSDWSEVTFDLPVVASLGALYVAFELPADVELSGRGLGGGPGIGYTAGGSGFSGWLSGDGEVWARLHEDYGFVVEPQFILRQEGMLVKSLDGSRAEPELVDAEVAAPYLSIGPNPFNPKTEVRFGLVKEQKVRLEVFDVRGRLVRRLVDEYVGLGHHSVPWEGDDSSGRPVASGVYFVRLQTEEMGFSQRILLVR